MQELRTLEMPALVELLATQTNQYTKMLNEGSSEEDYSRCCLLIKALQSEIELRKTTPTYTSTADSSISPE